MLNKKKVEVELCKNDSNVRITLYDEQGRFSQFFIGCDEMNDAIAKFKVLYDIKNRWIYFRDKFLKVINECVYEVQIVGDLNTTAVTFKYVKDDDLFLSECGSYMISRNTLMNMESNLITTKRPHSGDVLMFGIYPKTIERFSF